MIAALRIRNFALINALDLELQKGFTVITGETGSGKSILLNALGLLLGDRADFSLIGPESDKSSVEATVDIQAYGLDEFFQQNDLDLIHPTIIRREVSTSGRSRAFINDTPVQLTVLRAFTEQLVNIHSQYNTLELKNRQFQLDLVDTLGELVQEQKNYTFAYAAYKKLSADLSEKQESLAELLKQQDYTAFQLQELEDLQLDKLDFKSMEKEFELASNSEEVLSTVGRLYELIEGDNSLVIQLSKAKSELDKVKNISTDLEELYERLNSVLLEIKEIGSDSGRFATSLEIDPSRKELLLENLDRFNAVLRKHRLTNQEDLNGLMLKLREEVANTSGLEEEIERLNKVLKAKEQELTHLADQLHEKRLSSAPLIEKKIVEQLNELKLPDTRLFFEMERKEVPGPNGFTDLKMMFSANKGLEPVAIEKAASGGELSRVMLVIQHLIAERKAIPTVLFDEIDTGVSGDVAQKIGALLRKMGGSAQLIAITHLPQVAAAAQHHYVVEKQVDNERTLSSVRRLNQEEHVIEVARLMSGDVITSSAISNAKDLINAV
jgi:DNA repair protein RecN (Recombination protein N)